MTAAKFLLIAFGWFLIMVGMVGATIVLEQLYHRRKMAKLEQSYNRLGVDPPAYPEPHGGTSKGNS